MSVSIIPGWTWLILIGNLFFPKYIAIDFVKVVIPPFVIEYNGSSWEPIRPATELRLIIVLPNFVFFPASVKKGTKYLVPRNTPVKLIDISLWYSSSDTLSISLPIQIPALFTNISIRIFLFFKKVENSIHEFSSATSIW